jgi:hypothetical protein
MSEKIPPPKKMVSRSVAVALGIVCIILVAGLGGAVAYYTIKINNKDSTYNDYVAGHHHTDDDYASLSSENTNLNNIVNLTDSTVWVNDQTVNQGAGGSDYWSFSASYAGYVVVNVLSSTTSNAYVEVSYSASGANYLTSRTVGYSGTANFAVLPSGNIEITVGNSNLINSASETVTITYYY